MYRSFVTCDDPKGVVTCRTIRKSKPKPHTMEVDKRKRNTLSSYFDLETVMASGDEIHTPASFQLMEVSRGARKLNDMIDIWSKGGQPKDIADDLLRGAIDLQDSLLMLGKLQEASHYMSRLKKENLGRPRPDRAARIPSRDPTEELKSVIRESLVKQASALPKKPHETVSSESATESLSRSSSSSASSATKGPNLIAKLMGLEEYPSRPFQAPQKAQDEARTVELEKRSLKEILDGMRFKGVLRTSPSRAEDGPPIVLIKPVRAPCPEPCRSEPSEKREGEEEDPLDRRKLLRRFRRNEELRPKELLAPETIVPNGSAKPRASGLVSHRQQTRTEGAEKRSDEVRKVFGINRKVPSKDVVKRTSVVKPEEQGKRVLVKAKKSSSDLNVAKNQKTQSAKPSIVKRADQKSGACSNPNVQKKNYLRKDKPLKKSTRAKVIETSGHKQGEGKTEVPSKTDCGDVTVDTNILLQKEESPDISDSTIEVSENATPTDIKRLTAEDNAKAFLLTSPTFQTCAEELFDLATINSRNLSQESSCDHYFGAKLLLDFANEIIESKSSRELQTVQIMPMTTCSGKMRVRVSLETLADEVCKSVDALRSYHDVCAEGVLLMDCVYAMLERDLNRAGPANGLGSFGWIFGFSMDEVELVVNDVERLLLNGLIEEVFA